MELWKYVAKTATDLEYQLRNPNLKSKSKNELIKLIKENANELPKDQAGIYNIKLHNRSKDLLAILLKTSAQDRLRIIGDNYKAIKDDIQATIDSPWELIGHYNSVETEFTDFQRVRNELMKKPFSRVFNPLDFVQQAKNRKNYTSFSIVDIVNIEEIVVRDKDKIDNNDFTDIGKLDFSDIYRIMQKFEKNLYRQLDIYKTMKINMQCLIPFSVEGEPYYMGKAFNSKTVYNSDDLVGAKGRSQLVYLYEQR